MKEITKEIYEDVKDQYLKDIEVPPAPPKIQYLLCPIGLVGAGKTTVVKPLSEKLSLVRISSDEIRRLFKERGYGYEKVESLVFELTNHFLALGHGVCLDGDCAGKIKEIEKEASRQNLKIVWIHINPPEEFIISKLSRHEPSWLGTAEEVIANYYARKPLHADLKLDFTVIFDTSRPDLEQQIESSVATIEQAVGS